MATRTPSPMTPGTTPLADEPTEAPADSKTGASGNHVQRLLDTASGPPSATTASRAVPPPTVVRNKRLVQNGVGEAFLVWRCLDCGSIGSLDFLPQRCVCGASREALSYVVED